MWGRYILYTDGEISLEVAEVLCQLIAVVIIGEQALEKCQQLRETITGMKTEKVHEYRRQRCGEGKG